MGDLAIDVRKLLPYGIKMKPDRLSVACDSLTASTQLSPLRKNIASRKSADKRIFWSEKIGNGSIVWS
jgi:hypothetical protein